MRIENKWSMSPLSRKMFMMVGVFSDAERVCVCVCVGG